MMKAKLAAAPHKKRSIKVRSVARAQMPPINFNIAISTVDRPKNYIHGLIANLPRNVPTRLIVGSPSYSYLERYRKNRNIKIIGVDPTEWDRLKEYAVQYRSSWNYWRCFVYGVGPGAEKGGLLILEDDVEPAKGWEQRLAATIQQIEREFGEEYVLSLYTYHTELPKDVMPGRYFARYPAFAFGGTQAVYFPEPMRLAFSEYLKSEGVEVYRMPYDWLLSEYLRLTGIPLFITTPCLYEHIGDVTTGLSLRFHQAGKFERKLTVK